MGDFKVRKILDSADRSLMYHHAIKDIEAFEIMLQENMFEDRNIMIGAEQELCIVENNFEPATSALKILESINNDYFTNELALFNLEINLDPQPLSGSCFQIMESELQRLLKIGNEVVTKRDEKLVMVGILPTLKYRHLQFEYMTPIDRYRTLSETLSEIRGSEFEIHMQGVDDLIMTLGSVLFEACNTSFQLHLQIKPKEFVNKHNWSQMIAGPVLAACVNSPLLFGNELWSETRIALFKQSLDTRSPYKYMRRKVPRVYFGLDWLRNSPSGIWKNNLMRFPLIATSDGLTDSIEELKNGQIPDLKALQLHNGTTYTWNRMCYGNSQPKPHLRIECRYIPSGPSVPDEMANFAFWIGLMNAEPDGGPEFWKGVEFKEAKGNFMRAAKTGLSSVHNWYGKNYSAKILILEILLPKAKTGLINAGVSKNDIDKYLNIIEQRVKKEKTGSQWMIKNHRYLTKDFSSSLAQRIIVERMQEYQMENIPVHEWEIKEAANYSFSMNKLKVEEFMSSDIYSINENDSIELAENILLWNNIHHLPVENHEGDLIGLITDGILKRHIVKNSKDKKVASDIMIKNPITVNAHDPLTQAEQILKQNNIKGVPVVFNRKLVGILTNKDF